MPFITLEGPDRYGKTTQAALLYERIAVRLPAVLMHEPGGVVQHNLPDYEPPRSPGRFIRGEIHHYAHDPHTAALLFMAGFAYDSSSIVRPLLNQDVTVICDRWLDSCQVYQHIDRLPQLAIFAEVMVPDTTILLRGDPEEVYATHKGMTTSDEAFGANDLQVVRGRLQRYDNLVRIDPRRWITAHAYGTVQAVHRDIWRELCRRHPIIREPASEDDDWHEEVDDRLG